MCMHVPYCTAYVKDSGDLGVCCHEMPLVLPLDSAGNGQRSGWKGVKELRYLDTPSIVGRHWELP